MMAARVREQMIARGGRCRLGQVRRVHQRHGGVMAERPQRSLFGDGLRGSTYRPVANAGKPTVGRFRACRQQHCLVPALVKAMEPSAPESRRRRGASVGRGIVGRLRVELEAAVANRHQVNDPLVQSYGFFTFCVGRAPSILSEGLPACSHAPTITPAVAVIESARRRSSTGRTRTKNFSK